MLIKQECSSILQFEMLHLIYEEKLRMDLSFLDLSILSFIVYLLFIIYLVKHPSWLSMIRNILIPILDGNQE